MTVPAIAHQRLHSQHLLRPDFKTAADVVRWFGAVQAQDYLGALYAIGLRMPSAAEAVIETAISERSIIRTWPMRGTIHFIPPEDARWMLRLLARRGLSSNAAMYRRLGLTEDVFRRAHGVVAKALRGGKQLTRPEIYQALKAARLLVEGEQQGLHILGYLARHSLICFGPRRGAQHTFTLLDEWIPPGRNLEGEEALAELARRYFTSHGPATLQDFAWWSGLKISEARTGLQAVQSRLLSQSVDGSTYWFGSEAPGRRPPHPDVHLLPAFDEFTVAYSDRSAFVDADVARKAGSGIGRTIILEGRLAGTWKRTREKGAVRMEFDLLAPLDRQARAALAKAADRYGRFLGLPVVIDS